jgi:hypothetical protein
LRNFAPHLRCQIIPAWKSILSVFRTLPAPNLEQIKPIDALDLKVK